jgi:hypothetical protein
MVDSVEKRLHTAGGTITLKCKDFIQLYIDLPTAEDTLNVASSVEQLSNIGMLIVFVCTFVCWPLFSLLVCLTLSQLNIENTTKVAEILE